MSQLVTYPDDMGKGEQSDETPGYDVVVRPSKEGSMSGALLATLSLAPVLAGVFTVVARLANWEVSMPLSVDGAQMSVGSPANPIVGFAVNLALAWISLAWLYRWLGFTTIDRANPGVFGDLCEKLSELRAMAGLARDCREIALDTRRRVAMEVKFHLNAVKEELAAPGPQWTLGTGYINALQHAHRTEEALVAAEPMEWVIKRAQYDLRRLRDSTIDNNQMLAERLVDAIAILGRTVCAGDNPGQPDSVGSRTTLAVATLSSRQTERFAVGPTALHAAMGRMPELVRPNCPQEARTVVSTVRRVINEFQDERRAGLVRERNHLVVTAVFTGCTGYVLLWLALAAGVPRAAMIAGSVFFLTGVLVGLFGRLRAELAVDTQVDDCGLSTTRLVSVPVLSGVAAVLGVGLVVLAGLTQTTGATLGPLVAAGFDLESRPLNVLTAGVFGLTPGLLISRLTAKAEDYKHDLKGTEAPGATARRAVL